MRLRKKTLFTIGVTTAGLLLALSITSLLILLNSYSVMEEEKAKEDMYRVLNSFSAGVDQLVSSGRDYASWDDTYQFVQTASLSTADGHPYVLRNLTDETFVINRLNFLLLLNASGEVVFQKGYNLASNTEVPVPAELFQLIKRNRSLFLYHSHPTSDKSGILLLNRQPAAIASLPIIRSSMEGPIQGTLIAGYFLDSAYIRQQSTLTRTHLQLLPYQQAAIPAELIRSWSPTPLVHAPIWTRTDQEANLETSALLYDILGRPALVLEMNQPRTIYEQGKRTVIYFLLLLVIAGLIFGIVVLRLLERVILSRLSGLISRVSAISQNRDFSGRVEITGTDEISELEQEFNVMMSVLENAQRTIRHRAEYDSLTRLPNRSLFYELLQQMLQEAVDRGSQAAILFIDLDKFKQVNDTFGHHAGDLLLLEVAKRLRQCTRPDDVLSRLGGDEFIVLLPHLSDLQIVETIAKRIREALCQPFFFNRQPMHLSASIGISLFPAHGTDAEILVQHADLAMLRVKEEGKNNCRLFTPELLEQADRKRTLEKLLHQAIERDELQLHYQSKICMETGRIVGMEALLRWVHPELGPISPQEFIPIAEETGLISAIGKWVLKTACSQNKSWQDAGYYPISVAVNLSPIQFDQDDLVTTIEQVLRESQMEPRWLELEITESIAIQNINTVVEKLQALRRMGIRIAIDDFGTGYSSLSYLKRFPVDALKIDKSFVQDITSDANIPTAIIAMARSLRLTVTAEGVETVEQLQLLRQLRCDFLQGYLFSRPLPTDAFEQMLASQSQLSHK